MISHNYLQNEFLCLKETRFIITAFIIKLLFIGIININFSFFSKNLYVRKIKDILSLNVLVTFLSKSGTTSN